MKNKKNILFIVPSLTRAGAETQVVDLVNGLSNDRCNKYLFTFENKLDQLSRVDQLNIKFFNHTRRYKFDFSLVPAISKIINEHDIDIVHCSLQIALLMGWLGVLFSKRSPCLVVAVHTTINRSRKDDLLDGFLYQWIMRKCKKIVFVCETQMAHWLKKFRLRRRDSVVIYNGVDTNYFKRNDNNLLSASIEVKEKHDIQSKMVVFCCIAGFRPEKGHKILIDAFNILCDGNSSVCLLLVGDGPERKNIEEYVLKLNLEDRVKFAGQVSDVRPFLMISDCAIIASTAVETFSIAMLESMSMGVPLVATDVGGTKEAVIDGKTGLVVDPGSTVDLANALKVMADDEGLRNSMSDASEHIVKTKFNYDKMINETELLFDNIV